MTASPLEARCSVCLDTGSKSQDSDGHQDCTACDSVERRAEVLGYLRELSPYMSVGAKAWAAYLFAQRQVAPVAHPSSANGAEGLPELPEPLELVFPELNPHALGCGVEDRSIHDRYKAAEYGWQDGADKVIESIPSDLYDGDQMQAYASAAVMAERDQIAAMCDALKEQRFASGNIREGSTARTLAELIRARK